MKSISIPVESGEKSFFFHDIFSSNSTQSDVYNGVASTVLSTIKGFNATILSFGATASGKSYTMCGSDEDLGIIFNATTDIFRKIEEIKSQNNGTIITTELSFVELYNNQFRNLLKSESNSNGYRSNNLASDINSVADTANTDISIVPYPSFSGRISSITEKIELHEGPATGVFLVGNPNIRIPVQTVDEAHRLICRGLSNRKMGATSHNDTSSRCFPTTKILFLKLKFIVSAGVTLFLHCTLKASMAFQTMGKSL